MTNGVPLSHPIGALLLDSDARRTDRSLLPFVWKSVMLALFGFSSNPEKCRGCSGGIGAFCEGMRESCEGMRESCEGMREREFL